MYDVIVVGAGTAGCCLTMLLARRGHRVLLLERSGTAGDSPLTHNLGPAAVRLLMRWGLLEQLVGTGCPPVSRTTVWAGGERFELPNPPEVPLTYSPRSGAFASLTSAAAIAAGAAFRPSFTVKDLVWEEGAVAGVVGHGPEGHSVCERGRVVVGADGRSSLVARVVQAETYDGHSGTNCCYHAYWRGDAGRGPAIFLAERRAVALYPTDGALTWVVAARPVTDWAKFKRAPERMYRDQLAMFPELARRLRRATRESRFRGTGELGSSLRQPWGPGWALVGDAGHPRDGTLCLGTSDVCIETDTLARALDEVLYRRRPFGESLGAYQQARDTRARESEGGICALASCDWTLDQVADILARARAGRENELAELVSP